MGVYLNKPSLVIEFIGLPGAGKTTIAQNAIESLTTDGYRCFGLSTLDKPESAEKAKGGFLSKFRSLKQFAIACVRYRQIACDAFMYTMQMKPFSFINLRRFFVLIARLRFMVTLMKDDYDFIILDQGLLQYIWSIAVTGERPKNDKYLARLLKGILDEIPLFVIMVDIETEMAVERLVNRPTMRSRFDHMSPSKAQVLLSKHKEIFTQIVDSAGKFQKTGYLNVNGSQPIKQNVGLIVPVIEQTWLVSNA